MILRMGGGGEGEWKMEGAQSSLERVLRGAIENEEVGSGNFD